MPRKLYIPKKVSESIREHMYASVDQAVKGFWSANEDEDTLTGHLGACLKTGLHNVDVTPEDREEVSGTWKWTIDYTKFRGRGKNATETYLGADGIIEIGVSWGSQTDSKSLLFQSKTEWNIDHELVKQAVLLSTWREAAIAINYTPDGFNAYSIDSILASKGDKRKAKDEIDLKQALGDYFLKCRIGNTDLKYNPMRRILTWRADQGLTVSSQFTIPHRIRVRIQPPSQKEKASFGKMIPLDEIHNHRMQAEPEDVLMPLLTDREEPLKSRKKDLSLAYHPDRFSQYEKLLQDIATRRMQEVNAAYDEFEKNRNG
jgi:hypothetical protein